MVGSMAAEGRHGTGAVAKEVESSPGIQEASETLHPPHCHTSPMRPNSHKLETIKCSGDLHLIQTSTEKNKFIDREMNLCVFNTPCLS